MRLAIHAHSKRSAQGYIIDQFTNNNHQHHHQNAGNVERGRAGHNQFKSHSTTQTQTHLHNNNGNAHNEGRGGTAIAGKEKRDKGIQAAASNETATRVSHTTNGAGELIGRALIRRFFDKFSLLFILTARLEKSKSHSHVNGSSTGLVSHANNRASTRGGVTVAPAAKTSTALQRNASTSQVVGAGNRLRTDVKSRYMNISGKQSHRTAQPANDAVRQVKQSDYSSSGTSTRTASPQANRKATLTAAPKHIDSHMSLDSLASPKKQPMGRSANAVTALPAVHHDENSLSRDSLADSIRSSVRTEGTISQESLNRNRQRVDTRVAAKNLRNTQQKQTMNGESTSGGSTSSVGKGGGGGGRLMRNFSDSGVVFRNPGNASKGLSSNTSSSNASTRTSFLSKKSREILERRSLVENQQRLRESMEKAAVVPCPPDTMRRSLPINKSSSTSNIPTNRRIFNTTLHLRKTAEMVIPERGAKRESQVGLKPSRIAQKVPLRVKNGQNDQLVVRKLDKSERDLISTEKAFEVLGLNHSSSNNCDDSMDGGGGFEAKMVRSSTFSKDCPDLSQSIEIS